MTDDEMQMDAGPAYLPQSTHRRLRLNNTERATQGIVCFGLATLIVTAAWLTPDPAGLGTHRQLGLPGCTMVTWFGIRCPGCGMTTSWAYTTHGDFEGGIKSNVAGVLLLIMAIVTIPFLAIGVFTGFKFQNRLISFIAAIALSVIALIALAEWIIRLAST